MRRASPIWSTPHAWLKCHYPDVFAAALLNSQPMGFYAPAQIVRDAQEHGVEVRESISMHRTGIARWRLRLASPRGLSSPPPASAARAVGRGRGWGAFRIMNRMETPPTRLLASLGATLPTTLTRGGREKARARISTSIPATPRCRRHPHHPCAAARPAPGQRPVRRRWPPHRRQARRGLRFHPRSLAAHGLAPVRAGDARQCRCLPLARARRAAMRCGPSARCIARATRTICRCSRASPCRRWSPMSRFPPCCRASRSWRITGI